MQGSYEFEKIARKPRGETTQRQREQGKPSRQRQAARQQKRGD